MAIDMILAHQLATFARYQHDPGPSDIVGLIEMDNLGDPEEPEALKSQAVDLDDWLEKAGGPYYGPRGGKWADAAHTIPWDEKRGKGIKRGWTTASLVPAALQEFYETGGDTRRLLKYYFSDEDREKFKDIIQAGKLGHPVKIADVKAVAKGVREALGEIHTWYRGGVDPQQIGYRKAALKKILSSLTQAIQSGKRANLARKKASEQKKKAKREAQTTQPGQQSLFSEKSLGDWLRENGEDWMIKGLRKDDGDRGESLGETTTKELRTDLNDIRQRIDDPNVDGRAALAKRAKAIQAELERRAKKTDLEAEKGCGSSMEKGELTQAKAKKILEDGEVHGQPLTEQQRKFFGAIASGEEPQEKSQAGDMGDWLAKAGEDDQGRTATEEVMDMYDWIKAQTMPEGEPRQKLGQGPEQGGDLKGKGKTSGSNTSGPGPGQDTEGQVTGAHPDHTEVLSEDDEEDEQQMRPHKKPIESAKSLAVPSAQREAVAYENAAVAARLRKGQPDVHVDTVGLAPEPEPSAPLEKGRVGQCGMVRYSEETDMAVDRLFKSQDFYTGGSPSITPFSRPIGVGKKCPACGTGMSKSLTACPACGHGTVAPRLTRVEAAPRTDMAKSRRGLLRPRKVQDLKIDD